MTDKNRGNFSPEGKLTFASMLAVVIAFIFIIFPLFIPLPSSVMGVVVDDDTSRPIPDARVIMPLTNLRDTSDSLGIFKIDNLKPKKYYLEVSHNDYQNNDLIFLVPGNGELCILDTIRLSCGSVTTWPIAGDIINDYSRKSLFFNFPRGYSSSRSNRPEFFPTYALFSVIDSSGGRWALTPFDRYRGAWIFYMNPRNGSLSRCPTGLTEQEISSVRSSGDSLVISCVDLFDSEIKYELTYGADDMTSDSDGDGFIDKFEEFYGLDMFEKDTDHDGIDDFDDPYPTIPKPSIDNDTLEVLRKCLELEKFPFAKYEATGNTLTSILHLLPPAPARRLWEIARKRVDYFCAPDDGSTDPGIRRKPHATDPNRYRPPYYSHFKNFADRKSSFELTLAGMTPEELRYFYPYFADIAYEEKAYITNLELIGIADDRNIAQVRKRIIQSAFKSTIQPQTVGKNLVHYPAHPSVTGAMYIPYDPDKYPKKLLYNDPRAPVLNVVKIDNRSAIVQVKEGFSAWDMVFLKRDGEWILIDDHPYRWERDREDPCEKLMKGFLNLDLEEKMRESTGRFRKK